MLPLQRYVEDGGGDYRACANQLQCDLYEALLDVQKALGQDGKLTCCKKDECNSQPRLRTSSSLLLLCVSAVTWFLTK